MERPRQDDGGLNAVFFEELMQRRLQLRSEIPPDPATVESVCSNFIREHTKRYSRPQISTETMSAQGTALPESPPDHTECPICLDSYGTEEGAEYAVQITGIANCSHVLGSECLKTILRSNPGGEKRCPLCRATWVAAIRTRPSRFDLPGPPPFQSTAASSRPRRWDQPPDLPVPLSSTAPPHSNISPEAIQRLLGANETLRRLRGGMPEYPQLAPPRDVLTNTTAENPAPATGNTSRPSYVQLLADLQLLRSPRGTAEPSTNHAAGAGATSSMPANFTMDEFRQLMGRFRDARPADRTEHIQTADQQVSGLPGDDQTAAPVENAGSNDYPIDLTATDGTGDSSATRPPLDDTDMTETDAAIVQGIREVEEIRHRARETVSRARCLLGRRPTPLNGGVQQSHSQNNRPLRADLEDRVGELSRASEARRQLQRRAVLDELARSPRRSSNRMPSRRPLFGNSPERLPSAAERASGPEPLSPPSQPSLLGLLERECRVTQRELACDRREARLRRQEERVDRFLEMARRHRREVLEANLEYATGQYGFGSDELFDSSSYPIL
ncbi:uncharacterized protein EI97DRAFT_436367 [Westerdykella ornata]|uniref:RING-type domain-containing protein n=1 Tax=Westerdykella ornata TaxID=318751 RepID=A0A6A6JAC8_WESOR|nr:uncharacterized protein EI97DRAFT_436367 [Westerdykella ornata]KAF2273123.1 hypothetical protein EI97DRAFT_436367 [Westerdykella ornata]